MLNTPCLCPSMRVTNLTLSASRDAGGLFFSVKSLGKSLLACGVDTDVLAPWDAHTEADLDTWAPVKVTTFKPVGPNSFGYSPEIRSALEQREPDVMHVHGLWMYHSWACQQFSRATQTPYLVAPRGMLDPWALGQARWKKRVADWAFARRCFDQASCLHALNESELQSMRAFGCKNPVCVIPNGISLPVAEVASSIEVTSWQDQVRGRKTVLYIGRIHAKKGLINLIQAWARLDGPVRADWVLQIVGWGQGDHEVELKDLAETLGVSESVLFLGPRFGDEKDRLLRDADAFVHPSFSEGLPMAILEAWAYRLPVVMTPECNLSIGFERDAAISVNTDVEDIRAGLGDLMHMSDAERERMGQAGRMLVEDEFSWPNIAASMRAVYQWLLGGDRPDCVRDVGQ